MPENIIEFKIVKDANGQNVDLSNMSLAAVDSLLILLTSLTNIIKLSPNNSQVNIQILRGSAKLIAEGPGELIEEFESGLNEVLENTSTNKALVENWQVIQSLFKANGLQYEANVYKGRTKIAVFDVIKASRRFKVKVRRHRIASDANLFFLKGRLIEVGGKKPNIHIIGLDNEPYTINCDEQQAKDVNNLLYSDIHLSTWRKLKADGDYRYTFCDHYLRESVYNNFKSFIDAGENKDEVNSLIDLHNKIRTLIEERNFGLLKKFLRLYNHDDNEVSTLKTILVITKAFKTNEDISIIRNSLKTILESKIGPLV